MNRTIVGRDDLTASAKLVWLFLQDNYESVGECPVQFSYSRIGQCLGMSWRSVLRSVQVLQRAGLLAADRAPRSIEAYTFTPRLPRRAHTITVQSTVTQGAFGD